MKNTLIKLEIVKTSEDKYDLKFFVNDALSEYEAFELLEGAVKDLKRESKLDYEIN